MCDFFKIFTNRCVACYVAVAKEIQFDKGFSLVYSSNFNKHGENIFVLWFLGERLQATYIVTIELPVHVNQHIESSSVTPALREILHTDEVIIARANL